MARRRRIIGLLTACALVAIVLGTTGVGLPLPRLQPVASSVPGVRGSAAALLVGVGINAPPGGEFAFVAVAPGGNLVVSDRRRDSILRFDPEGHLLSEWGPRLGATLLGEPAGVAVQADATYVLDRGIPRILRLDASGRLQDEIDLGRFGTYGLNGLAVDSGGNLYVADTGRNRILVLSPTGQRRREVGRAGADLGAFTQPMALAFAPDGAFYVADWENARVERWDATFTATNAWSTGFRPFGLAVDQQGRVFVPDTERHRVEVFNDQGAPLGALGGSDAPIAVAPRQVALAASGPAALYVLGDVGIDRVSLQNTPPPPQPSAGFDAFSAVVIAFLVAIPVLAALSRRGRRRRPASVGAAFEREVWLDAKNGAQRQHQQAHPNQDLLVAHQAERKDQSAGQDDQPEHDAERHHLR